MYYANDDSPYHNTRRHQKGRSFCGRLVWVNTHHQWLLSAYTNKVVRADDHTTPNSLAQRLQIQGLLPIDELTSIVSIYCRWAKSISRRRRLSWSTWIENKRPTEGTLGISHSHADFGFEQQINPSVFVTIAKKFVTLFVTFVWYLFRTKR